MDHKPHQIKQAEPNGGRWFSSQPPTFVGLPVSDIRRMRPCPSMGNRSSAHTPLTREVLRAERMALHNSNAASTAERRRQQQEEARLRRNATKHLRRQERNANMRCVVHGLEGRVSYTKGTERSRPHLKIEKREVARERESGERNERGGGRGSPQNKCKGQNTR